MPRGRHCRVRVYRERHAVNTTDSPEQLLASAMSDARHIGRLLDLYRNYLRMLARVEIGRQLQAKVDASDLVQEVMLEAAQELSGFSWRQRGRVRRLAETNPQRRLVRVRPPLPGHAKTRHSPRTDVAGEPRPIFTAIGMRFG